MTIYAYNLAAIHSEFGLGYNLGAYRGVQWWLEDGSTGYFSASNISLYEFYGKRSTPPYQIYYEPAATNGYAMSGSPYYGIAGNWSNPYDYQNYMTAQDGWITSGSQHAVSPDGVNWYAVAYNGQWNSYNVVYTTLQVVTYDGFGQFIPIYSGLYIRKIP